MIVNIQLDKIKANPWQTRLGEDPQHIAELAADIRANGLMQVPVGRFVGDTIELAFGHNRWAAYRLLAGDSAVWGEMPVDVRQLSDEQMAIQAWAENERRRDVTPIERARAIQKRIDDFHWTHETVADKLGVSRPMVSNALRLLKLPEDIQDDIQHGRLSERQAQALLPLYDLEPDLVEAHKYHDTIRMIADLARGGMPSDELRQRVNNAVEWFKSLVQPSLIAPAAPTAPMQEEVFDDVPMSEQTEPARNPDPEELSQPARPDTPGQRFAAKLETQVEKPAVKAPERPVDQVTSSVQAAPVTPAPAAPVEPVAPPALLTWDQSTIVVTITLMPVNGDGSRAAMVGLRANNGAPAMRFCSEGDLDLSSAVIAGLMDEVKSKF